MAAKGFCSQLFISYSHQDRGWLDELVKTLTPYLRRRDFTIWDDSQVRPGDVWHPEIQSAIETSHAAVVLMSREYLASTYISDYELPAIEHAVETRRLKLLWVLLGGCPYHTCWVRNYQAAYDPRHPLDSMSSADRNSVLTEIAERIRGVLLPQRQSIILPIEPECGEPVLPSVYHPSLVQTPSAHTDPTIVPPGEVSQSWFESELLFAALAAQMEIISPAQLTDTLVLWSVNRTVSLRDMMLARDFIQHEDRTAIDRLLRHRLQKHGGQFASTLAAVADSTLRQAMRQSGIPEVRRSIDCIPDEDVSESGVGKKSSQLEPRYERIRLHRDGPLGQIWFGRDLDLDRDVALKTLAHEQANDRRARQRFLREAQITARLEHPNIVPIYELVETRNTDVCFAMRFLRGHTLSHVIGNLRQEQRDQQSNTRDRRRLLEMFLDVCNAVAYAHAKHVIHRDLKPDNVVLGEFGEVYLLDWGLAQQFDASYQTVDEAEIAFVPGRRGPGSPAYMSPEQAAGRLDLIDTRTDVYGLGAVLFEILTGRPPHEDPPANMDDLLQTIVAGPSPSARDLDASLPPVLNDICAKAMAKSRSDRFGSAGELAAAVQLWLDEEPLETYRANIAWWTQQSSKYPKERSYQEAIAKQLINLALVLTGMHRHAEADKAIGEAISRYESLLQQFPKVIRYRADLAGCRLHHRSTLFALDRIAEAELAHRQALEEYSLLHQSKSVDRSEVAYASLIARATITHLPEEIRRQLEKRADEAAIAKDDVVTSPSSPQIVPNSSEIGNIGDECKSSSSSPLMSPSMESWTVQSLAPDEPWATLAPESTEASMREFGVPVQGPRYRLLREHAQGALGRIFIAFDESLKREVAIKELTPVHGQSAEARHRFVREAEITAHLEHPGIVPIYSLGIHPDGRPFFAMKLIRGLSLRDAIRELHKDRDNRAATSELRHLLNSFLRICEAVSFAHVRGVIHRDLKPDNIVLGQFGESFIIDWGLAKVISADDADFLKGTLAPESPESTMVGQVLGTPAYMSPEQAQGRVGEIGPASDIFALGGILYEILSGRPPYHGKNVGEVLRQASSAEFARPRIMNPRVDRRLEAVCLKALALRPEDRYRTTQELAADIERLLIGDPVSIHCESLVARLAGRIGLRRHLRF